MNEPESRHPDLRRFHARSQNEGKNPKILAEQVRSPFYLRCGIDLAFELGPVEGLTVASARHYIRYRADRRLTHRGLNVLYDVDRTRSPGWTKC